jgi:hypothetical protein
MSDIFDLADTWNDGATTFTAIKMNVTDTASAAASNLMDLQVGGVSRFSVSKGAGAIFATNLIEQRNGVNAQTFNLYNTYTDASNYERGFMRWSGNVLQIGSDKLGTGSARALAFQTDGVTRFSVTANTNEIVFNGDGRISRQSGFGGVIFGADNSISIGAAGSQAIFGGYQQLTEMTAPAAPAANGVRIYAEDDGAGKTRLMARFATGAAVQIAIEP